MSTIEKALLKNKKAKKVSDDTSTLEKAAAKDAVQAEATTSEAVTETLKSETKAKVENVPSQNVETNENFFEIDLARLDSLGYVSTDSARRLINEEYRAIKRKLLQNAFGPISKTLRNSNIIMVSSARPGEGKTFTAVNLALSIASEKDKTVLLVDADVLKPNVSKSLNLEPSEGLMEYLLDEKQDIADVMYKTNVDKLRIIPAGRSHHLSTELLASQKMHETIDEIASRYPDRIVIIDTPPLIGINETAILANFAGQAVVVTVEGKSRLSDLTEATSHLNQDMAIGFVVNQAIVSADSGQGYYGYYYAS